MTIRRKWFIVFLVVVVASGTGAWVRKRAYYRSDDYRRTVEAELHAFFGLPIDIQKVEPVGLTSRRLYDVTAYLPGRRAQIFHATEIHWNGGLFRKSRGAAIEMFNATWMIGAESWQSDDYMRVLRASFQHDFATLGVRRIELHDSHIQWHRRAFQLSADGVRGQVMFDEHGAGRALLTAGTLNGRSVSEPVRIDAVLDPASEAFLPEVTLTVPELPLTRLRLDHALQSTVTHGTFAGRIVVREFPGEDEIELSGQLLDVRLEELTPRLVGGPVPARVDLEIDRALIRGRRLMHVCFNGRLSELQMNALLRRWGWPEVGGSVTLKVDEACVGEAGLEVLRGSGVWSDGDPDVLTEAMVGRRGIGGRLNVNMRDLEIRDGRMVRGIAGLTVKPARDRRSGFIDRSLLSRLTEESLGLTLPGEFLPDRIEYSHIGARLSVDDGRLRIRSGTGPAGPAMVTARVLGVNMPLLGHVNLSFDLDTVMAYVKKGMDRFHRRIRQEFRPATMTAPLEYAPSENP